MVTEGGCPCLLAGPCGPTCPCVHPLQSGPCRRCATHGSIAQRSVAAMHLAKVIDAERGLAFALTAVEERRFREFSDMVQRTYAHTPKFVGVDGDGEATKLYPTYTFHFTNTGIGHVADVTEAVTGLKCSLTDYDSW